MTTSEFVRTASRLDAPPFSLLEQKGLFARLTEEFTRASSDLAHDPRAFIRAIFADDTKDTKRRRRIRITLAYALVAHAAMIALIAFLGWHHLVQPKEETGNRKIIDVVQFPPKSVDKSEAAIPHGKDGGGGGGGGNQSGLQATKGVLPKMSPAPQIVKPLAMPVATPVLPVAPTIRGAESPPPPNGVAIGMPNGVQSDVPAPGSGEGDGMGGGKGPGAGKGEGPGTGPGSGGNKGTNPGNYGSPVESDATPSVVNWPTPPKTGYTPFSWLYKARAIITPEAEANKAVGTVLLKATFHADGRITDIRVVNPVAYMTEAAIDALERSKFRPATINGKPITLTNVLIKQEVHY
ncbi:MAG: TonB family protein [Blastocatellia bacterium]